jgi:hypothetical protein
MIVQTVMMLAAQRIGQIKMRLRSRTALAAETLFLQKQLALYQEPNGRWRCDLNATRVTLVWLSYWFDWQPALTIVQPETFKRWRRQGWRLVWKTPAKPGRPPIPAKLQALIRRMARENVTWGQKRIANELWLKLGLRVSPRTVRKYMPRDCVGGLGQRCPSQRWFTFTRNQAQGLIATGVAVDFTRYLQILAARLMGCVQHWRGRSVARRVQQAAVHGAVSLGWLHETAWRLAGWSPDIVGGITVDERSPPAMGSPRTSDLCTVVSQILFRRS